MSRPSKFPVNVTVSISTAMDQRLKAVCDDALAPTYIADFIRAALRDALHKVPVPNGQLKEHA
jgi:hypothetical protein